MNSEVFESNKNVVFGVVGVVIIGVIVSYLIMNFPIWIVLVVIPVSIIFGISIIKTKVIIEDGQLRYETWARGEEVDLMKVSQIVTREVETIGSRTTGTDGRGTQKSGISIGNVNVGNTEDQERKVEKVMYVIDKDGRTFFSFPASTIGFRHRNRFRDGVHAVNPNIDMF